MAEYKKTISMLQKKVDFLTKKVIKIFGYCQNSSYLCKSFGNEINAFRAKELEKILKHIKYIMKNQQVVSATDNSARIKETYLNRDDSKVVVELEPTKKCSGDLLREFRATLKEGQFFDDLRYIDSNPDLPDYDEYCDSEGILYEVDYRSEEWNTNEVYIFNFELDDNQKKILIELFKTMSNELATECICDWGDDEMGGEHYVCENSMDINELVFKYNDYFGKIVIDDTKELFTMKYDIPRTLLED